MQTEDKLRDEIEELSGCLRAKQRVVADLQHDLCKQEEQVEHAQRNLDGNMTEKEITEVLVTTTNETQKQADSKQPCATANRELASASDVKDSEIEGLRDVLEQQNQDYIAHLAEHRALEMQEEKADETISTLASRIHTQEDSLKEIVDLVSQQSEYLNKFVSHYHPEERSQGGGQFVELVQTAAWLRDSVETTLKLSGTRRHDAPSQPSSSNSGSKDSRPTSLGAVSTPRRSNEIDANAISKRSNSPSGSAEEDSKAVEDEGSIRQKETAGFDAVEAEECIGGGDAWQGSSAVPTADTASVISRASGRGNNGGDSGGGGGANDALPNNTPVAVEDPPGDTLGRVLSHPHETQGSASSIVVRNNIICAIM